MFQTISTWLTVFWDQNEYECSLSHYNFLICNLTTWNFGHWMVSHITRRKSYWCTAFLTYLLCELCFKMHAQYLVCEQLSLTTSIFFKNITLICSFCILNLAETFFWEPTSRFKGTKWTLFGGKRIHSTWYWKGSFVSAGIRTPNPWITKWTLYHWAVWLADE